MRRAIIDGRWVVLHDEATFTLDAPQVSHTPVCDTSDMAIGLKLDIEFTDGSSNWATFGDLKRFVAKAEAGGVTDDQELTLERDENEEIRGFSVWLDPNR